MLVLCWPKLSLCCPMLTPCWPKLPLSCPYVDRMFTYVGLGNALPHSSDRIDGGGEGVGTGWGRGGDEGRRLGGRASITFGYHRRPPARTRTWDVARRPDLRATPSKFGHVSVQAVNWCNHSGRLHPGHWLYCRISTFSV